MSQENPSLQKGIRAARRGYKEPAQRLLRQAIQVEPNNEQAWMWLSRVVDVPQQRTECLQRVLSINPDNHWAAEQLAVPVKTRLLRSSRRIMPD